MPSNNEDHAWDEYKLLQDKLDKIGDFRFRVKTWCVGIFTGYLYAGSVSNRAVYLLAALVVVAFGLLERHHLQWHRALSHRAWELEQYLNGASGRDADGSAHVPFASPGIVRAILSADRELRRGRFLGPLIRWANSTFYFLLIGIAITLFFVSTFFNSGEPRVYPVEFKTPITIEKR